MKQHKHNPCSAYSPVRRFLEFCIHPLKYLDWKSQTGRCDKCMKMIAAPTFWKQIVWTPVICFAVGTLLLGFFPNMRRSVIWILILGLEIVGMWVVPMAILAFGNWKAKEQDDMTDNEFVSKQAREVRDLLIDLKYGWKLQLLSFLVMVLIFACLALSK